MLYQGDSTKFYPDGYYRCNKSYTYPSGARILTKGCKYLLRHGVDMSLIVDGRKTAHCVSNKFFENHFDVEHPVSVTVYKLVRMKKDGNCYPLFIGKKKPFLLDTVMPCEYLPTKGFAPRSVDDEHTGGWHCCFFPVAPHLSEDLATGEHRVWLQCEAIGKMKTYKRGLHQGGDWVLVENLIPRKILSAKEVAERCHDFYTFYNNFKPTTK